mgnify:CR=1 FL=1
MPINVKVAQNLQTRVRFSTNNTPIVIKTGLTGVGGVNLLRNLYDVDMTVPDSGNILVYDADTQKFVLESPNEANLTLIDGGTF